MHIDYLIVPTMEFLFHLRILIIHRNTEGFASFSRRGLNREKCKQSSLRAYFPSGLSGRGTDSFNPDPFPGLHIMNILGNLAGVVSTAFEVPGNHDVIRAPGDILRVFDHICNSFPED